MATEHPPQSENIYQTALDSITKVRAERVEREKIVRENQSIWHVVSSEDKIGPISFSKIIELIQTEKITHHSLVWRKGMKQWQYASQIPEFEAALSDFPPPLTPPPPIPKLILPEITPPTVEKERSRPYQPSQVLQSPPPPPSPIPSSPSNTPLTPAQSPILQVTSQIAQWVITGIVVLVVIVITFGGRACREQKQREKVLDAAEYYRQTH